MVNADITFLQNSADKARKSLASVEELVAATKKVVENGLVDSTNIKQLQKEVLLDSFAVKKFHRDYKEWESSTRNKFVDGQIKAYNKKYAQISRLHGQSSSLEDTLRELQTTIKLPTFEFSIQTLEQYEGGRLLEHVEKDANGEYPRRVSSEQVFSLDPNSPLPHPSYREFNELVNIEYRLRIQLQIKYEVLLRIKASLAAKNSQWATRDSTLNKFITQDLPKVILEVNKIKTSEYEDLKYYEEDYDMEEQGSDAEEKEEKETDEIDNDEGEKNEGEEENEPNEREETVYKRNEEIRHEESAGEGENLREGEEMEDNEADKDPDNHEGQEVEGNLRNEEELDQVTNDDDRSVSNDDNARTEESTPIPTSAEDMILD